MSTGFEVVSGVAQHWHQENQIVTYKLSSVSPTTLQEWSDVIIASLDTWSKDKPYLAIHDISQSGLGLLFASAVQNEIFNVGILPPAQPAIDALCKANPDWQIRLAVIVSSSLSGRLARVLFQKSKPESQIQFKAFFYEEPALKWLNESIS